MQALRLGVNLDHLVAVREARHTPYPDLAEAITVSEQNGGDGITLHLREDRRHVQPQDMFLARRVARSTLNMEMAPTPGMVEMAVDVGPDFCCLVPERREELTTEGGLDVIAHGRRLREAIQRLTEVGIQVSLFIEPDPKVIDAVRELGAPLVELHTGTYCNLGEGEVHAELERIRTAARHAADIGLKVNAGHGLHAGNVGPVAAIPQIEELNIGHAIVARALITGLGEAVREMRAAMDASRKR
ncbi:MAG: pyridoxine 5'-phosphate synthase [Pseudomonadota bacterium]|nr:pyridoxine 5'-phosphate synthase [Pseudomonadota bacterium]